MATKTKQKQGCLSVIFPFLGRKTTKTIFKANNYNSSNDSIPAVETIIPETLPYRVRDDFLSPAEFSFYKILSSAFVRAFAIHAVRIILAPLFLWYKMTAIARIY